MSNTTFHRYNGPGIYYVGKYGINLTTDLEGLVGSLRALEDDENEDEFELYYDTGEGSMVYIEEVTGPEAENNFENIFKVIECSQGGEIHYQQIETDAETFYYGTDHSIFGSGNVEIKVKGKVTFKWE